MTKYIKNKKVQKTILILTLGGELLGIFLLSIMKGPDMSKAGKVAAFFIAFSAVTKAAELLRLIYRD